MGSGFTGRKTTLLTEVRPILLLFFNAPNLGSKRIYQRNASQAPNCSGLSRNYKNLLRKLWNNETHTHRHTQKGMLTENTHLHSQRAVVLKADCCLQLQLSSQASLVFNTHSTHNPEPVPLLKAGNIIQCLPSPNHSQRSQADSNFSINILFHATHLKEQAKTIQSDAFVMTQYLNS